MDKKEFLAQLSNNKKKSKLKVGNLDVEIDYLENGKSIDECMLNILKRKSKKD